MHIEYLVSLILHCGPNPIAPKMNTKFMTDYLIIVTNEAIKQNGPTSSNIKYCPIKFDIDVTNKDPEYIAHH